MSKPLPIWQDLPVHFKEDVVGYLDFLSRLNLRFCSKSDQSLVDGCPFDFYSLEIDQNDDCPLKILLTFVNNGPRFKFDSKDKNQNATALFNLLSHRNSKCYHLDFYCDLDFSLDILIKEFIGKLKNPDQKLNVSSLCWSSGNSAVIIRLLRCLKPGVLNEIRMLMKDFEDETKKSIVKKLVETGHLENGREIHLYDYLVDDYFQNLLGFDNLNIRVRELTEKMLLDLMDAVKTRNPPLGSQFVISSEKVIEVDTLKPTFQDFEGVLDELKKDQTPQKAVHLVSDSTCLVVIKWNKTIEATVCGRENWQDDLKKYHGLFVFDCYL